MKSRRVELTVSKAVGLDDAVNALQTIARFPVESSGLIARKQARILLDWMAGSGFAKATRDRIAERQAEEGYFAGTTYGLREEG